VGKKRRLPLPAVNRRNLLMAAAIVAALALAVAAGVWVKHRTG
jgi:hypothetical protein